MTTPLHRPAGVVPRSFSLDVEADGLLRIYAPTQKALGRFLSRLVYEHHARHETRQELRQERQGGKVHTVRDDFEEK